MGARSKSYLGAALLVTGTLGVPVLARDYQAPIISFPTSAQADSSVSRAGLLSLLQTLQGIREQLRSLENQSEIESHRIQLLKAQQQAFFADFDRQLRRLAHQSGSSASGSLPPDAATLVVPAAPTTPPSAPSGVPAAPTTAPGAASVPPTATLPPNVTVVPPGRVAPPTAATGASAVVPPDTANTAVASVPTARAAYDTAFNDLRAGRYNHAVAAFQGFLVAYPTNHRAEQAQYWIAETQYVERHYRAAQQAFTQLVHRYPHSKRVPNARLKLGYIAKWGGHPHKAQHIWQALVQHYPDSTAAEIARQAISHLGPS
ncbi:MAG: tol-pal system protein YbgF [Acidiferrobacter sp.]